MTYTHTKLTALEIATTADAQLLLMATRLELLARRVRELSSLIDVDVLDESYDTQGLKRALGVVGVLADESKDISRGLSAFVRYVDNNPQAIY